MGDNETIKSHEPVAIAAAVRAIILCAVAFGLKWSAEQVAAIMLALEAVLAVVVRSKVTPNQNVVASK